MTLPTFRSANIFGIHEPGGEQYMKEAGHPGWIVFTEGIGSNPHDHGGRDYRLYSDQGFGIVARLNNGYAPEGTIPYSSRYADFATRCANFVAASQGCKTWIIGNEMNYVLERPLIPTRASRAAQPDDNAAENSEDAFVDGSSIDEVNITLDDASSSTSESTPKSESKPKSSGSNKKKE